MLQQRITLAAAARWKGVIVLFLLYSGIVAGGISNAGDDASSQEVAKGAISSMAKYLNLPPLNEVSKGGKYEAYRLSLHHALGLSPQVYTLVVKGSGKGTLIYSRVEWPERTDTKERAKLKSTRQSLSKNQVARILNSISISSFWTLPNTFPPTKLVWKKVEGNEEELEAVCVDGVGIWVEGIKGNRYHWSHHGCPWEHLDPVVDAFTSVSD